jgi:hypothetical protein
LLSGLLDLDQGLQAGLLHRAIPIAAGPEIGTENDSMWLVMILLLSMGIPATSTKRDSESRAWIISR